MGGFFGIGEANAAPLMTASASDTIAGGSAPPPQPVTPPTTIVDAPVKTASVPKVDTIVSAPVKASASAPAASGDIAQAFDAKFKGTPLQGQWGTVEQSANKYGMDPKVVAAIMAHETGNGKNVRGNNPGGLMDPATHMMKKQQFGSIESGIDATARVIAKNYNAAGGDLGKLANIYAPVGAKNDIRGQNSDWLPGVRKNIQYFGDISY